VNPQQDSAQESGGCEGVQDAAERTLQSLRAYLAAQASFGLRRIPRQEASSEESAEKQLQALHESIRDCRNCGLSAGRHVVVFGDGDPDAGVMFVGEAPGAEEDRKGLPFVGKAGELLTRMIESIGLTRETVYIANVIKCRPPGNRDPDPEEVAACQPYLLRQIRTIRPTVICTLGRFAAQTLLQTDTPMGKLRGHLYEYEGIKLVPTYHPAALLRNEQWKRPTWEDLKRLRLEYDGVRI
jgi:uracil-DNA glycosylase